ncbi:MAG TPA: protocatechuate 3,4-dioxygenase subunit alpha [Chloroflexota bacterium]|nr:protocatechuate 3,4-dioxygenase subunit alpha [Chloroflexota bacterium]
MAGALRPTASQTVGPFFEFGLLRPPGPEVVPESTPGAVRIEGTVFDGRGDPVPDAMIEIWQAWTSGRYAHPDDPRQDLALAEGFTGFGRSGTDGNGCFWFRTVKPGPVPWTDGRPQAPHLNVSVFARGLLHRLVTRLYFPDESEANAADPLLASLPDARARRSLIAVPENGALRFDIRLQGDEQTCFLQI